MRDGRGWVREGGRDFGGQRVRGAVESWVLGAVGGWWKGREMDVGWEGEKGRGGFYKRGFCQKKHCEAGIETLFDLASMKRFICSKFLCCNTRKRFD